QVERGSAVREFVRLQLAEQDGARLVQLARTGSVFARDAIDADAGAARGQYAFRIVDVLQAERDAVQGAAVVAAHDLALGAPGLAAGEIGGDRDECVELRLESLDAREIGIGELERGQLARSDEARRLGDGPAAKILRHELSST